MSWLAPTRADHERFCRVEGWTRARDAQGKTGTHHITYELALPDGRILRHTHLAPPSRVAYGRGIWAHALRDQLDVDDATFRACVRDAKRPSRGARPAPAEALPAELVALLTRRVGLAEHEVAAMTKEEAVARLNQYWSTGR